MCSGVSVLSFHFDPSQSRVLAHSALPENCGTFRSCRVAWNNPDACHLLENSFAVFTLLSLHTRRLEQLAGGVLMTFGLVL